MGIKLTFLGSLCVFELYLTVQPSKAQLYCPGTFGSLIALGGPFGFVDFFGATKSFAVVGGIKEVIWRAAGRRSDIRTGVRRSVRECKE